MNVRREVSRMLRDQGFKSFRQSGSGRAHLRRIDSEFSLVVDVGPLDTEGGLSPFIGIRHGNYSGGVGQPHSILEELSEDVDGSSSVFGCGG
jgi:hypothetical protein